MSSRTPLGNADHWTVDDKLVAIVTAPDDFRERSPGAIHAGLVQWQSSAELPPVRPYTQKGQAYGTTSPLPLAVGRDFSCHRVPDRGHYIRPAHQFSHLGQYSCRLAAGGVVG